MKTADVVIEFVITGTIGMLALVFLFTTAGLSLVSLPFLGEDGLSKAIAGVLALPAIYYLGIAFHHASWWGWRRCGHRPLFRKIFKKENPRKAYAAMRELAQEAYKAGGSPLGAKASSEAVVEWCRFAILSIASEDARREYARQHHLYRGTYGPLSALILGFLVAVFRALKDPGEWWLPVALLAVIGLLGHAAWHRGARMWKSLCYSTFIAHHDARETR